MNQFDSMMQGQHGNDCSRLLDEKSRLPFSLYGRLSAELHMLRSE
jgi:hypothetical protein